jgi:hypothetical protein
MTKEDENKIKWSDSIAELIVDALLDCELIEKEEFQRSVANVSEELFVRLLVNDYQPPNDFKLLTENTQQ